MEAYRDRLKVVRAHRLSTNVGKFLFCCADCERKVIAPKVGRSPTAPYCSECRGRRGRAEWRSQHREHLKVLNRRTSAERSRRARSSGRVRAMQSVSAQIRTSLHGQKDGRSWEALVGYSRSDLVRHLERQFLPGMSWDNFGDWHIDHIVAASTFRFDEASGTEFRACWALSNLRPLWAAANIAKGARRLLLV